MKTKPRKEIDIEKAKALAARGLTNEKIAQALGISDYVFYARKRESKELSEALSRARSGAEAQVADKLWEIISKKEDDEYVFPHKLRLKAIQFYLERRCGWCNKQKIDIESPKGTMSPKEANINLSTMTPEQIAKLANITEKDAEETFKQ